MAKKCQPRNKHGKEQVSNPTVCQLSVLECHNKLVEPENFPPRFR